LTKGQNVCAVIRVETAVPDIMNKQTTDHIEIINQVNSIMKNCKKLIGQIV